MSKNPHVGSWTFKSSDDPMLKARPERLPRVFEVHAEQKPRERVFLYSILFALAPERSLEIGVRFGGGSRIVHAALSDLGRGRLISLDPQPEPDFDWNTIADRATLIVGKSPDALPRCRDAAGGAFDFAFVDGDHSEAGVRADLVGLIPITAPGAVVLLHDAYHAPIERAAAAASASGAWIDCGILCTTRNEGKFIEPDKPVTYGGVRMLRRT